MHSCYTQPKHKKHKSVFENSEFLKLRLSDQERIYYTNLYLFYNINKVHK